MSKLTLKEVSELITKGTTPSSLGCEFVNQGINFIKSESISDSKYLNNSIYEHIDDETDKKLKRSRIKEGDLLFSIAGAYLGKIAIVQSQDVPANTNQAVGIVRLKRDKVNVDYVYYYFSQTNINAYINKLSSQSSQPNLNLDLLGKLEFEWKDIKEQQKIASVLSSLDSKIELNNRINAELEAMAKTLYDYWFVQFDFPDEDGRPYKSSGGRMVWSGELGREVPEGWDVKSIDYYADVIDPHPSHRAPKEVSIGFPFAGIGDIDESGNIDLNKARVIDEEFVLKQECDYKINEYSIGYGRVGTVGKVVKLRKQDFRYALSPTMAIINPKNSSLPSFVYFTVINPTFFQWVNKYTSGSTRPAIGIQHLRTIPVIRPKTYNENLLEKFEGMVSSAFRYSDILNKENQKLAELRDWLLPMLMNGQVRVV